MRIDPGLAGAGDVAHGEDGGFGEKREEPVEGRVGTDGYSGGASSHEEGFQIRRGLVVELEAAGQRKEK